MMYKRLIAAGMATLMLTGSSMTAAAAAPGSMRGGMQGPGGMGGGPQQMQQGMDQPPEQGGQNDMGQPPEQGGQNDMGQPPEQGGQNDMGQPPQMPEGVSENEDRPEPPQQEMNRPPMDGDQNGLQQPPEKPEELTDDEDRPELPEKPEELTDDEDRPDAPQGVAPSAENGQKNPGFFGKIGNAVKSSVDRIGNWFRGIFGKKNAEEAQDEDDDQASSKNTDQMTGPARPNFGNGDNGPQGMPGGRPGENGDQMPGDMPDGMPGGMGGESAPTEYDAATVVTEDAEGETYTSTTGSENAILADGTTVTLSGITVEKTGDSDGESADFYGINAGILANNGAGPTLTGTTVTTDGAHANGVFSYGEGTTVKITDSTITTTGNNSGGLMTTGGGTLIADNVEISTSGNSSAAIRTDRGGGTVITTNSTGTTAGVGSPAIYSTADIRVGNSTLTADDSEAVVIEGGNSVTVTNSDLTGNNATLNGQSTKNTNVLIYQSMSGDASEGDSEFTMIGGSLTSLTGSMFHVTNVTTTINLKNVTMNYAEDSDVLLDLSADSWGKSGSNGGNATVNLSDQTIAGQILVDDSSSLVLNIADGSSYTGAINSTGSAGSVKVILESGSTWTLTADTYIDSFDGDYGDIDLNGYVLYVNGVAYNG